MDKPSGRVTATVVSREQLATRWLTARGQAVRQELLLDLRHEDGKNLARIAAPLRRGGVPEGRADLRGIDLKGEDLAAACLRGVDLSGADLRNCDLACASLDGADLRRADLRQARMRGAAMRRVQLQGADLRGADLTDAELSGAAMDGCRLGQARTLRTRLLGTDLTRADLVGADLRGAFLRATAPVAPGTTRRVLGPPPPTEPLRIRDRRTVRLSPAPSLAPAAAPAEPREEGKVIQHPSVRVARAELQRVQQEFDAALAQLLALRGAVDKISVTVDGEEQVLFSRRETPVLRVRGTA